MSDRENHDDSSAPAPKRPRILEDSADAEGSAETVTASCSTINQEVPESPAEGTSNTTIEEIKRPSSRQSRGSSEGGSKEGSNDSRSGSKGRASASTSKENATATGPSGEGTRDEGTSAPEDSTVEAGTSAPEDSTVEAGTDADAPPVTANVTTSTTSTSRRQKKGFLENCYIN